MVNILKKKYSWHKLNVLALFAALEGKISFYVSSTTAEMFG